MDDKFKVFKKWFWIGILGATMNAVFGVIYGISLFVEKEHRTEGVIIFVWAIFWGVLTYQVGQYLAESGFLPTFQMVQPGSLFQP